jgi:outer membrane protein
MSLSFGDKRMPVSRIFVFPARAVALLCVVSLFSAMSVAQQAPTTPPPPPNGPTPLIDYSKGKSALTFIGPYTGRDVAPPVLGNAPRIDQLLKNGQIMLSPNDAIALALENNLDLAIARYNLNIADTDVLRAKSGSSTRGVNTGLVSGTPGGGGVGSTSSQGGGAGGTTTGAGGAGSGTGGIVSSTAGAGSAVDSFDPILSGTMALSDTVSPVSNTITSGLANIHSKSGSANFGLSQGFQTGSLLSLTFNNQRASTNSITQLLPSVSSSFRAQLRQHLLQGFGFNSNTRFIRIAKINREISDVSFRNQVITTVSQIQNIYWDLVSAYEDVKVKERSLAFANKTLSDNQKQVQIGTLAPIEITRAQAEVATRQQDLIISQTNLQLQQLLMKNAVTRNMNDQTLAAAPVIPTDTMVVPQQEQVRPVQDLLNEALSRRPDIASQRMDLKSRDITKKSARNALLPTLDLVGWYGGSGLTGDPVNCSQVTAGGKTSIACTPDATRPIRGYGGAFGDAFDTTNPDKGIALSLNIPIRNRAAQADQVRSELEYRQAEMRLQQLQNQIGIEVRNAAFAVQQNRARVEAARSGRELQVQNLDAEQKRYALGASTNTLVLQAQRDLATAEANLVSATAAYEKSRVELDRVTGYTLDRNGIQMADAETGYVQKQPTAPNVAPRTDPQPTVMQQQQQSPQ